MAQFRFRKTAASSIRYLKIIQHQPELILSQETGVPEVAALGFPVLQAPVVERFQIVRQDEGDDAAAQALLEQQQTANASVAVLEGVDALEAVVEVQQVVEGLFFFGVVIPQRL